MYNRVNSEHSSNHQPFSHMLTSIDVIKQGCQLQFVRENEMHPILRPNYMSHIIPASGLAKILLWGHLSGIWGLIPKKFENLIVCRVDLYMNFFILERKRQHYAADVFKLINYFSCCQLTSRGVTTAPADPATQGARKVWGSLLSWRKKIFTIILL